MTLVQPEDKIVEPDGTMNLRFRLWTEGVTKLDIIIGTGTPETFVQAEQGRLYMDETGTSGNILYIKRDADIGGDRSQGWILV